MRKTYISLISIVLFFAIPVSSFSQKNFFLPADNGELLSVTGKQYLHPIKYEAVSLDHEGIREFLWSLPAEKDILTNRTSTPVLVLPMPDGSSARFHVWESSIQEPALEEKFPEIKTFAGQGIDDPYATIRFGYDPYFGFRAQILSSHTGRIYIEPIFKDNLKFYMSYFHRDNSARRGFSCLFESNRTEDDLRARVVGVQACRGATVRTYRAAISCTGEYAQAVGGGLAGPTHAAIVTSMNNISGVYETELSIRFVLVANNDLIEYLNPTTDPFPDGNDITSALLTQNQNNTNFRIGGANYDIGHLFTAAGSGLAAPGVVCSTNSKAMGASGSSSTLTGNGYDIDYVAHEMGHQFNADHSFNSDNCASSGGSYEPGGGTTILAYAGICDLNDNIQPSSDPVFHGISYDEINSFLTGLGGFCGTVTNTGNALPQITSMGTNSLTIPVNTPFTLTGTATDADGDALTYSWEGWNQGDAGPWHTAGSSLTRPLFRTRLPKTSPSRTFPDPRIIAAGYPGLAAPVVMDGLRGEVLPTRAREMRFRLTVRDNRGGVVSSGGGGCQSSTNFVVKTIGLFPFAVTIPNGGQSYPGGTMQTVTWNVAGTDTGAINTDNVKITLSTDGGLTYPHLVSASTANDGSEDVLIPAVGPSNIARIKIEAIGNVFFDISNANFSITGAPTPSYDFTTPAAVSVNCGSASATVTLGTTQVSGFSTPIALSFSGNPAGTTVTFAPNPVSPGSTTQVTLNNMASLSPGSYTVTVTGTAGALVRTRVLTFTVSAGGGPTISAQPTPQNACLGGPVTFNVTATNATSYQWQVSTNGGTSFTQISGATSATYSVPVTTAGMNNYQYNVIVTNSCGSVISANALLTLVTSPTISAQPVPVSVCAGSNAVFNITSSTPATYQWFVSTNGGGSFSPVPGATSNPLTVPSVTSAMNGNRYQVTVTNACGTITSSSVALTITAGATISVQPGNASGICVGQTASFSVTATGPGLTYQWQLSTDGGTNYSNITGANAATYTTAAVTSGMNNYRYRVIVGSTCGSSVTSQHGLLTVVTGANITSQPVPVSVCAGANASFSVTATGATGYQWQVSTNGGSTFSNISGATSSTLNVPAVTPGMNNYQYHVLVSGCATPITSSNALLTVTPSPTITTSPVNVSSCVGGGATFTVAASNATSYQWQVSTDGGNTFNNISGETNDTLILSGLTAGLNNNQYRVSVTNACGGGAAVSLPATLTIAAGVAITTQPVSTSGCAGSNVSFTVAATGAGGYQWQVSTDGGSTFTNITDATAATLTLNAITTAMNNNRYQVLIANCGPTGITSTPATLTINPGAVITSQPINVSACPGADAVFTTTASGATSYQWQVSTDGGVSFNNIVGANQATITVPAVNPGMNNNQYLVIVTGTCGNVTSTPATLAVGGSVNITTQPSDFSTCEGGNGTASVVATNATGYQWQVSTNGGTTFSDISGATSATLDLTAVTAGMDNNQYRVIVTGACGNSTSSNATLTINEAPAVIANGPANAVCAGSNVTLTGSGAVTYTWNNGVTDNVPFIISATNTYTVTGTDGNGCSATATITVTVNAAPVVTITADDTQLTDGEVATLTASSIPAAASYIWFKNGNVVAGATGNTLMVTENELGDYSVQATDANGCPGTSNTISIAAGVTAFAFITPNPSSGTFKVSFKNEGFESPTRVVTIYDEKGSLVYRMIHTVNYSQLVDVINVSLPQVSKGSYWLTLSEPGGRRLKSGKLIIQ